MGIYELTDRVIDPTRYPWGTVEFANPVFPGWTPANITTALWLDAADSSTITEVSGAVSEWADKSGNDRHATNTSTGKPTTSTLDGKTAIAFSSQFLNVSCSLATNMAVFEVFTRPSASTKTVGLGGSVNSATPYSVLWWGTNNVRYVGLHSSGTMLMGSSTDTGGFLFGLERDATTTSLRVFGGTAITANSSTVSPSSFTYVGRRGADYHAGLIAEIVVVLDTVSADDREKIEGYLAHKWGLAANLPSDHPYKDNAP